MNDFGTNPAQGTGRKAGKQAENFGIVTIELPNGQRLDGYILLSEKNAGKLGVGKDALAGFVKDQKKGSVSGATLHLQFGDREVAVAEPVAITFA